MRSPAKWLVRSIREPVSSCVLSFVARSELPILRLRIGETSVQSFVCFDEIVSSPPLLLELPLQASMALNCSDVASPCKVYVRMVGIESSLELVFLASTPQGILASTTSNMNAAKNASSSSSCVLLLNFLIWTRHSSSGIKCR
jgi:hypothetical protein